MRENIMFVRIIPGSNAGCGNVQYGELMDFCYVWLRRLVGNATEGFSRASTRSRDELTGNVTQDRGLTHFTEGLSSGLFAHGGGPEAGSAPGVHVPSHKLDAYCAVGGGDPGCRARLFGLSSLSR